MVEVEEVVVSISMVIKSTEVVWLMQETILVVCFQMSYI